MCVSGASEKSEEVKSIRRARGRGARPGSREHLLLVIIGAMMCWRSGERFCTRGSCSGGLGLSNHITDLLCALSPPLFLCSPQLPGGAGGGKESDDILKSKGTKESECKYKSPSPCSLPPSLPLSQPPPPFSPARNRARRREQGDRGDEVQ